MEFISTGPRGMSSNTNDMRRRGTETTKITPLYLYIFSVTVSCRILFIFSSRSVSSPSDDRCWFSSSRDELER
jgi:hypothetical protein